MGKFGKVRWLRARCREAGKLIVQILVALAESLYDMSESIHSAQEHNVEFEVTSVVIKSYSR